VPVDGLALVSPVTTPCRVVTLATNYVSHIRDTVLDPDTVPCTFFRKASGSISGPYDDVIKPSHVRLLDYELEIGLVFGRPTGHRGHRRRRHRPGHPTHRRQIRR
jgi:2-keto-4-pentenoate hydratase/2-oxohepta-3-ene-1,7-dioic acid hydratase in catechol pathway